MRRYKIPSAYHPVPYRFDIIDNCTDYLPLVLNTTTTIATTPFWGELTTCWMNESGWSNETRYKIKAKPKPSAMIFVRHPEVDENGTETGNLTNITSYGNWTGNETMEVKIQVAVYYERLRWFGPRDQTTCEAQTFSCSSDSSTCALPWYADCCLKSWPPIELVGSADDWQPHIRGRYHLCTPGQLDPCWEPLPRELGHPTNRTMGRELGHHLIVRNVYQSACFAGYCIQDINRQWVMGQCASGAPKDSSRRKLAGGLVVSLWKNRRVPPTILSQGWVGTGILIRIGPASVLYLHGPICHIIHEFRTT